MGYSIQQPITGTWVPTFTGYSADPTSVTANYTLIGNWCTVVVNMAAGTSNATTKTITLPFTSSSYNTLYRGTAQISNNGTTATTPGVVRIGASTNICNVFRDYSNAAFTASGTCLFNFTLTYQIA